MVTISADISALELDIPLYAKLARKTLREATIKQGSKVVWAWKEGLTDYTPKKGSVRADILSGFKAGRGILIRPSAYRKAEDALGRVKGAYSDLVSRRIMRKARVGKDSAATLKGLNRQAVAARYEIAMRERARGFSTYGARASQTNTFGAWSEQIAQKPYSGAWETRAKGKKGQLLSVARIVVSGSGDDAAMRIVWGSDRTTLGDILTNGRQQAKLSQAIRAVHEDMMVYVRDRLARRGMPK